MVKKWLEFDLNSNHVEIEASNCTYDVGEEGEAKFLLQDVGQELLPKEEDEYWMYELYCDDQQLECLPEEQHLIVKPTLHNGTHNYAHINDDVNELEDSHQDDTFLEEDAKVKLFGWETCAEQHDQAPENCVKCGFTVSPKDSSVQVVTVRPRHKAEANEQSIEYACNICDKSFPRVGLLTSHLKLNIFKCLICGICFKKKSKLDRHCKEFHCEVVIPTFPLYCPSENTHRKNHHGQHRSKLRHKCNICGAEVRFLKAHLEIHSNDPRYQCESCGACFTTKNALSGHKYKAHSKKDNNYCCDQCGKLFGSYDRLDSHKRSHSGNRDFLCDRCGLAFIFHTNFRRHMLNHEGRKLFKCSFCTYVAYQMKSLDRHLLRHKGNEPYICLQCGFRTAHHHVLNLHKKSVHYKAKVTRNRMSVKWKQVNRIPVEKQPFYNCDLCDYMSVNLIGIKEHKLIHTGEGQYKCNECKFTCSQTARFIKHMNSHHGNGKYQCDSCSFSVNQITFLKEHIKVHDDVRPFSCEKCGFACKTENFLNKHQLVHGDVKAFECSLCHKKWLKKRELTRHVKRKHPEHFDINDRENNKLNQHVGSSYLNGQLNNKSANLKKRLKEKHHSYKVLNRLNGKRGNIRGQVEGNHSASTTLFSQAKPSGSKRQPHEWRTLPHTLKIPAHPTMCRQLPNLFGRQSSAPNNTKVIIIMSGKNKMQRRCLQIQGTEVGQSFPALQLNQTLKEDPN
uniref:C2H2-type domain-containing protein n=1 Tax=Timema genevievae TaxID=629358 RepID=A0A7R9K1C6_TIMGE|nr:unnamed protein product [Timema genevievae]